MDIAIIILLIGLIFYPEQLGECIGKVVIGYRIAISGRKVKDIKNV